MIVVPAVCLGLVGVLAGVFFLTFYAIWLSWATIGWLRNRHPSHWQFEITNEREIIAIAGGVVAVIAVIILYLKEPTLSPMESIGLVAIGYIISILSFVVFASQTRVQSKPPTYTQSNASNRPPPADKPPPAHKPPPVQKESRPPPAPVIVPSASQDYYRTLLARAQYNQSLVDRLLEEEARHQPSASFDERCKNAIARLERGEQAN